MTDKFNTTNDVRESAEAKCTETGSETDYRDVPVESRRETRQSRRSGCKPGPACTKPGYGTRSRSGSASSVSSQRSDASVAKIADWKNRRYLTVEVNRLAIIAAQEKKKENPRDYSDSEPSDDEEEDERVERPSRKRKRTARTDIIEVHDSDEERAAQKRDPGRPPSTGGYVGLAAAQEEYNAKLREEAEIEAEKGVRSLSSTDLYSSMRLDLDSAVEEMRGAPSADVANRARKCMVSALQVAKVSKNLQSTKVRELKQASVVGATAIEVLRSRSDGESDRDTARQVSTLRKELETARKEARQAREEAQRWREEAREEARQAWEEARRLREELDAERAARERESRRRVLRDFPSPPRQLESQGGNMEAPQGHQEDSDLTVPGPSPVEGPTAMEIEVEASPPAVTGGEAKKKEKKITLPPREEWPPVVRPAIQGRVKIIEDVPLDSHTTKVVDREGKIVLPNIKKPAPKDSAEALLERLAPMLERWLLDNLRTFGLDRRVQQEKEKPTKDNKRAAKKGEQPVRMEKAQVPIQSVAQQAGPSGISQTGEKTPPGSTTWSEVVKRKVKKPSPSANNATLTIVDDEVVSAHTGATTSQGRAGTERGKIPIQWGQSQKGP